MEVTAAPEGNWARKGERFIVAAKLLDEVKKAAKIDEWQNVGGDLIVGLEGLVCAHPLRLAPPSPPTAEGQGRGAAEKSEE